ncbi:MAG: hypothetical protein KJ060_15820 [Candidatus Hydrogenedentes bacterium]|nr:hypothetical protein [Candidatus Hydrogenedentota bacterium]
MTEALPQKSETLVEAAGIEAQAIANKGLTTAGQNPSNTGQEPVNVGQYLALLPSPDCNHPSISGHAEVISGQSFAPKSPPRIPPDLQLLVDRWEALPQGIRAAIKALLTAHGESEGE